MRLTVSCKCKAVMLSPRTLSRKESACRYCLGRISPTIRDELQANTSAIPGNHLEAASAATTPNRNSRRLAV